MQAISRTLMLAATLIFTTTALASQETPDQPKHTQAETRLVKALSAIKQGQYSHALDDLASLIKEQPDFKLAQYVYGQLMVARTGRGIDPTLRKRLKDIRVSMINGVRSRWKHRQTIASHVGQVPAAILKLAPAHQYAVVVDLSNNRLYLFANDDGLPRLIGDFYSTIASNGAGKRVEGDKRTPIGIYTITQFRSGSKLPSIYGTGALPLNYPNPLDKLLGRTGYGIWIHGVPQSTYARAPRATLGCVAVSNDVFQWLRQYVEPGQTPVILAKKVQWLSTAEAQARRSAIMAQLQGWVESWEAIDTKKYLAYYGEGFTTFDGMAKAAFAEHKYNVNSHKTSINVDISQLSIFRYPGTDAPTIKLSFKQDYDSNNFDWLGTKVQFWRKQDNGTWRIALERSHG